MLPCVPSAVLALVTTGESAEGFTLSSKVSGALDPAAFRAVSGILKRPAPVGVPVIKPLAGFIAKPAGKSVAEKLRIGPLVATI